MIRSLKVVRKWQGKKEVSSLNIAGVWLQEHNFNIGDCVRVEVFRDEIRIKRVTPQIKFDHMNKQNPALGQLAKQLGCVVCD